MKLPSPLRLALLVSVFVIRHSSFVIAQGPLTPPGAPAPTMKTLDQLEPRIDVFNAPASAVTTTDASYQYIITKPGSYFLSGNLTSTKANAIRIAAAGVTLDLQGFEISRTVGIGSGVEVTASSQRATVRNGNIRDFSNGINDVGSVGSYYGYLSITGHNNSGLFASGRAGIIESCRVTNGGGTFGIFSGPGATLGGCVVSSGTYTFAISASEGSSLTRCVAANNLAQVGIAANAGSTLSDCVARSNTSAASLSQGISAGGQCTITQCTSSGNRTTFGAPTGDTGAGFAVFNGSTIQLCTTSENQGDGIQITGNAACLVRNNICESNGFGGNGAGIHAVGGFSNRSTIDSNHVLNNDRGIDVDGTSNLIIRNTATANTTANYDIGAGNKVGPVVLAPVSGAILGSTAASSVNTTDPWANLSY